MRCCGSCLRTARRPRAWSSSPSAATAAVTCASIPTSICSCCLAGASAPRRSGSCGRSCTRSGTSGVVIGHQVRELDDFHQMEADNPEFLLALLDARPVAGARALFDRFSALFHTPETHAHILTSLLQLIEERHARFNATLYQLEPDVKEAPGALRDLAATRTIALLTDPLLLRRGPADPARFDDAEDFLLRVRSALHMETDRNQNVLSHEMQERIGDLLGYPGTEPRQRVERLMSDYFRHARIVARSLEWARKTAPAPVGPNLGLSRDGIRFLDPIQAARDPTSWIGAFQAAIDGGTEVTEEALSCIQQHVDRYRADDFFPDQAARAALLAAAQTAGRAVRASLGDARLRAARTRVSGVPGDLVARGARLLPQVHGRRAHAADDSQSRTVVDIDRSLSSAPAERPQRTAGAGAAGAVAAAPRRRQVARRRSRHGKCAHGARRGRSTAVERAGARDRAVSDQASPAHVARGLQARHRRSGHRQGLRRVRRDRISG